MLARIAHELYWVGRSLSRAEHTARLLDGVCVLYRESHPALSIKAAFSPDLPPVEVDPNQIKRAVLNLVDNAVEAVGESGEVVVETIWLPDARRARIAVADTGPGIAGEDKERLFVPYFSTKTTGMGLGLPIVHQIVTDHGGIDYEALVDSGPVIVDFRNATGERGRTSENVWKL